MTISYEPMRVRTCPFCQFTYCTDIEENRTTHRAFHRRYRREYLRVYQPQPEPRLAVYGAGDVRVDATRRWR
jgi:zinc-finger of acetyl-transferase ESCO